MSKKTVTVYNTNCAKVGDDFENRVVEQLIKDGHYIIDRKVRLEGTYSEADIVSIKDGQLYFIEAKGGYPGKKKLPGAQRSDNVRKAQSSAFMIKRKYPEVKYMVYFSAKPKSECPKGLIQVSLEANLFDSVEYLTYDN
jgi:Holliday junction resolvase-like predicted endonuclease